MGIQRLRIAHTFTILLARRMCENLNNRFNVTSRGQQAGVKQAGVRSFIITFDVYVILNIFDKYDNKRPRILLKPINFVVLAK